MALKPISTGKSLREILQAINENFDELAPASGKKIVTLDINGAVNDYKIPVSRANELPSLYSVAYAVREAMPVRFPLGICAKGKDLYPSSHADYNKMIFVGNERGIDMIVGDPNIFDGSQETVNKHAVALAKLLQRGYQIFNVTKGSINPIITHIDYTTEIVNVDGNPNDKMWVYTIKIDMDSSQQDWVVTNDSIWLQQSLLWYMQPYYIEPDTI